MEPFLRKYGPTYQAIWDDLGSAELDEATRKAVSDSTAEAVKERTAEQLRATRDNGLIAILKLLSTKAAL